MSLFAKIGRLIKQNKLYEIEEKKEHFKINIKGYKKIINGIRYPF